MDIKKMVYICEMDLGNNSIIGIKKKVFGQIAFFKKHGYDVTSVFLEHDHVVLQHNDCINQIKLDRSIDTFTAMQHILLKVLDKYEYSYIRFSKFRFSFVKLLKKLSSSGCLIVIEIPTYPFEGEEKKWAYSHGTIEVIKYQLKRIYSAVCKLFINRFVKRIVTYSQDEKIWNIQTIHINNGVDTAKIKPVSGKKFNAKEIHAIAVSACDVWHGYDRVIKGMKLYFCNDSSTKFIFHIVGEGAESDYYKQLVNEYNLEDYVFFHGIKVGNELDEIYNKCDVAIDALGRHRVGVYYNSSIKGKEYAAKGLPIVSGVRTEFDDIKGIDFYLRVPADDTPVDISSVIQFCEKIYKNVEIQKDTRKIAEKYFDFDTVMQPVIDYFDVTEEK